MAKEKKEEKASQPKAPALPVGEFMQFMVRPLKELEHRLMKHIEVYKDDQSKNERQHDRVESAFKVVQDEIKRVEQAAAKASSEAMKADGHASKYAALPERLDAVEQQMAGVLEEAKIGELVRQEQKSNARELDRLMKTINGCNQDLQRHQERVADLDQLFGGKLKDHAAGLKAASKGMVELNERIQEQRGDVGRLLDIAGQEMKARQDQMAQSNEQNMKSLRAEMADLKAQMMAKLSDMQEANAKAVDCVKERLAKFDEECEMMAIARKDVNLLERRMDKVVSVLKELRAQYEFEV